MRKEMVTIDCDVIGETPSALKITDGSEEIIAGRNGPTARLREIWIPRSQIDDQDENTITIPEWLAKAKGLI